MLQCFLNPDEVLILPITTLVAAHRGKGTIYVVAQRHSKAAIITHKCSYNYFPAQETTPWNVVVVDHSQS